MEEDFHYSQKILFVFLKFYYFLIVLQFDLIHNHYQVKQMYCMHDCDKKVIVALLNFYYMQVLHLEDSLIYLDPEGIYQTH